MQRELSERSFQPMLEEVELYRALDELWANGREVKVRSTDQEARFWKSSRAAIKLAGSCMNPRAMHQSAGVLLVRCRKCKSCLGKRRRDWMVRACLEAARSERTWFVTLTFRPYCRSWLSREADIQHSPTDVAYGLISPYIKRVRKISSASLKFISCVEMHKDNTPHMHLLVYQQSTQPILWKHLVKSWRYGFAAAKLATPNSAHYVCKYLGKQMKSGSRIRVSRPFGKMDDEFILAKSITGLFDQKRRDN